MTKIFLIALSFSFLVTSDLIAEFDGHTSSTTIVKRDQGPERYGHVDTIGLYSLISAKVPLVILDARTAHYDDGNRIPGAISLPYNTPKDQIVQAIPDKSTLIITYCTNKKCPASMLLSEYLIDLGYSNVIKYPEGIKGWIKAGFPIEKVK